jgi:ribosome-associated protein
MTDTHPTPQDSELQLPGPLDEVVDAMREKKAEDIAVLDLRESGAFTDYFVVCSGRSGRQVKAIVDGVQARLKGLGRRPAHIEGYTLGDWVLVDCFDFIVHVFTPETRSFYSLERLWGSAERMETPE